MINRKLLSSALVAGQLLIATSYLCPETMVSKAYAADQHNKNSNGVKEEKMLKDINITASIKRKLFEDPEINGLRIHVTTEKGFVTLTGTVSSEDLKEKVSLLARNTPGVAGIVNKIEIGSKNIISDMGITTLIKLKLLEDPSLSSFDIQVETVNGKVTFTGVVPDKESEEEVQLIAIMTNGVKEVESKLEINQDKVNSAAKVINDSIITANIKLNLYSDVYLDSLNIHVKTVNGKVTLTGKVPNQMANDRAILLSQLTYGVKEVESKLKIEN